MFVSVICVCVSVLVCVCVWMFFPCITWWRLCRMKDIAGSTFFSGPDPKNHHKTPLKRLWLQTKIKIVLIWTDTTRREDHRKINTFLPKKKIFFLLLMLNFVFFCVRKIFLKVFFSRCWRSVDNESYTIFIYFFSDHFHRFSMDEWCDNNTGRRFGRRFAERWC